MNSHHNYQQRNEKEIIMTGLFASNYANSQDNVIMRWCVSMCGCLFRKIGRATLHIIQDAMPGQGVRQSRELLYFSPSNFVRKLLCMGSLSRSANNAAIR